MEGHKILERKQLENGTWQVLILILPHVTYPHPNEMEHFGHMKTVKFRKKLTAFDTIHPCHKQRGIVMLASGQKILKFFFKYE
jgi:hypothetical protein